MDKDPLRQFVQDFIEAGEIPLIQDLQPPPEPAERGLKSVPLASVVEQPTLSLDDARDLIASEITSYGDTLHPPYMLVIGAEPGVGKSYAAVAEAQRQAEHGRRVLFAGPRHDLFVSLMNLPTADPSQWYEWQPRKAGDLITGEGQTCVHADNIGKWLARGHQARDFCSQICGWNYMTDDLEGCVYYRQSSRPEPIIYGMHQHVFLGHTIPFNYLIGDEYPINAALHQWTIPGESIVPPRDNPQDISPATPLLKRFATLAETGDNYSGAALLGALGGADALRDELMKMTFSMGEMQAPRINRPGDSGRVAYAHVPELLQLLYREVLAYGEGDADYVHRIVVEHGRLMLLMRRRVNPKMPGHTVWLDGTVQPRLYEVAFDRPVRVISPRIKRVGKVYQLWDRANGKSSMIKKEGDTDTDITHKVAQARLLVDKIVAQNGYTNAAVFTFKSAEPAFEGYVTGHFGAETGDNRFENCDAMFVIGTPLPAHRDLRKIATMLFQDRMNPFQATWSSRDVQYPGQPHAYPVGDFWGDPDLQAVAQQSREAAIVQAAHRSRINIRQADVWLLTNVPLESLPPDELFSAREILGAPEGVNVYKWTTIVDIAEECDSAHGYVSANDLMERANISEKTARKYIRYLIDSEGWNEFVAATRSGAGRPTKGAHRDIP